MSYVSVVAAGLILFVVGLWFTTKRGVFKGPRVDVVLLNERRNAAIYGEGTVVEGQGVGGDDDLKKEKSKGEIDVKD